ncbi:hypothetical protein [Paraburkholderia sp. J63]|uniref:aspartate racemase/maleate isomerase family protein n=1 Tax=Paraburkholderia sp. J63 TaxID=2805434 RepID=UPI002ABD5C0B|nr:hypothetical protein [Paraburkholderia sp. J63]
MSPPFDETAGIDTMTRLFRAHLELCRVRPGEKVTILTEGGQFAARVHAYGAAARALGAEPCHVDFRPPGGATDPAARLGNVGRSGLGADRAAMATLKASDLVIDMMLLLFSREQLEIQQAGARIVLVVEPFETLARLFPTQDLRRRVEAAERRLARARTLRFTNAAGTDVTYDIADQPILTEYGYADEPGRWDHWPGGFLATTARPRGVNGRVVLAAGDLLYPLMRAVSEPVEITIRDGMIVDIAGGAEAHALLDYIATYLEDEGIEVVDALSLEIEDNLAVGARDPLALVELSRNVRTAGIDVLVASACVQMPSLAALDPIERRTGIPTVSAASCTAFAMLSALGLDPVSPGFGAILAPMRLLALEEPAP